MNESLATGERALVLSDTEIESPVGAHRQGMLARGFLSGLESAFWVDRLSGAAASTTIDSGLLKPIVEAFPQRPGSLRLDSDGHQRRDGPHHGHYRR